MVLSIPARAESTFGGKIKPAREELSFDYSLPEICKLAGVNYKAGQDMKTLSKCMMVGACLGGHGMTYCFHPDKHKDNCAEHSFDPANFAKTVQQPPFRER